MNAYNGECMHTTTYSMLKPTLNKDYRLIERAVVLVGIQHEQFARCYSCACLVTKMLIVSLKWKLMWLDHRVQMIKFKCKPIFGHVKQCSNIHIPIFFYFCRIIFSLILRGAECRYRAEVTRETVWEYNILISSDSQLPFGNRRWSMSFLRLHFYSAMNIFLINRSLPLCVLETTT